MSKFWSETVKGITPYVPGEQPGAKKVIKLNTNENPYPPPAQVIGAMKAAVSGRLKLYPDPECVGLRKAAADYYGLPMENIFAGNGSDEILAFCFKAFFNPGETILFPDITYSFYEVYARLFDISYKKIPLDEHFDIPVESFFEQNGGILIANPNAPTGKFTSVDSLRQILVHNPDKVVIIDEAYIDFGGESCVPLIPDHPNLLVVHTFSKSRSLAGLRVGLALGQTELIEGLNRVKNSINSYTLDAVAQVGGEQSLRDTETFELNVGQIITTRDNTVKALRDLQFEVVDSRANFIFVTHPVIPAVELFEALRQQDIIVRYFAKPRIDNYLRVSIGTDEEMEALCRALEGILAEKAR
ncbi:histidinol-phosphate aminotransferase [Paenibacillus sophorae]|uniref:Histidinol-phosphate aminotransferase n=1 Tax=Paenibacillus sophorae TaxID=1333845 RepID=A0A1H8FJK7_9BACL|nr:histidinol-phosphate transaminase [Paenibacillus sophorae]QWU13877.1 histidinol-phosphate transaminase [Paenibacillus sophorae]SEN31347.1 histidinol-phosphate aminotransferase [Paenibacillus sophorae]